MTKTENREETWTEENKKPGKELGRSSTEDKQVPSASISKEKKNK